MKICKYCEDVHNEDTKFCPNCGKELEVIEEETVEIEDIKSIEEVKEEEPKKEKKIRPELKITLEKPKEKCKVIVGKCKDNKTATKLVAASVLATTAIVGSIVYCSTKKKGGK